jgi:hypothetical protein
MKYTVEMLQNKESEPKFGRMDVGFEDQILSGNELLVICIGTYSQWPSEQYKY